MEVHVTSDYDHGDYKCWECGHDDRKTFRFNINGKFYLCYECARELAKLIINGLE